MLIGNNAFSDKVEYIQLFLWKKMDFNLFVYKIITIFLVYKAIILPLCVVGMALYQILSRRKNLSDAGKNYVIIPSKNSTSAFLLYLYLFALILIVILSFLVKSTEYLIFSLVLLPILSSAFSSKSYEHICGFYENGIINGNFIPWKKIHSWKRPSEDTLILLDKDGQALKYDRIKNIDEVIQLLKNNNVPFRE